MLSDDEKKAVCELFAGGASIVDVAETLGVSPARIAAEQAADSMFAGAVSQARAAGYDVLADRLLHIYETEPDVQRARGMSENIKWLISKRKVQSYGDRLDVHVTRTLDLGDALRLAHERIEQRLTRYQGQVVEGQVIDFQGENEPGSTDSESVDPSSGAPSDPGGTGGGGQN